MNRFVVFFVISAFASTARASIISIENDSGLMRKLGLPWPMLQQNNSSALNEQSNQVTDVFTLAQLTAVPSEGKLEGTIRYTLGKRVQNDRMVGYGGDVKRWSSPQDVTVNLRYPASGLGATLTFVEIIVDQSSNVGSTKIITGGIGQRSVAIVLTAQNTYWFNYLVNLYGL